MVSQPPTPETNKMIAAHERLQTDAVGDFLYWLTITHDYRICQWNARNGDYQPVPFNVIQWLAEYADVDLELVNKEKEAVLRWIRETRMQDDIDQIRKEQQEDKPNA